MKEASIFKRFTPVNEALNLFLTAGNFKPVGVEEIPSTEALDRVLAENVVSKVEIPAFNRSAMDGYAVRAEDTFGATPDNPKRLKVVGRVDIGEKPSFRVNRGEAAEVYTGVALPEGANAVLMVEYARRVGVEIEVYRPVTPWENVTRVGGDVKSGCDVLRKGRLLRPQDLAMLSAVGISKVRVFRKPRVAIISIGSELVEPFKRVEPGKVVDVNRVMLKCMVESLGAEPVDYGLVEDDISRIRERLKRAVKEVDIILTTGGVSVGRRDLVSEAVEGMEDSRIVVHGVSTRPGKPVMLTILHGKPLISLPGPPAAAYVDFEVFARPVIRRVSGLKGEEVRLSVKAKLSRRIRSKLGFRDYVRVKVVKRDGELVAEPLMVTGSGILTTLTETAGFIVVPENREGLERGETVEVFLFTPFEVEDADV